MPDAKGSLQVPRSTNARPPLLVQFLQNQVDEPKQKLDSSHIYSVPVPDASTRKSGKYLSTEEGNQDMTSSELRVGCQFVLGPFQKLKVGQQMIREGPRPYAPNGYVLIQCFSSLRHLRECFWRPDKMAIVKEEPDDFTIDLRKVKAFWEIETCLPVSPIHWKVFEPSNPDKLSPMAIHALREVFNCISFVESERTDVPSRLFEFDVDD
ncbi:hypothetical protein H0H87_009277 [Tephrocybe sp. NHM501043]|nr:hypothetical protein H0H87_009277 [Tephrocybe sp. NHM501043]